RVKVNDSYTQLIDYWKGEGPAMTEEEAFQAVLQFAENHKIENCVFQKDVVDAMIRQPHTIETKPYKKHTVGEKIFFSDYDLGRVKYAYYDNDTANYHLEDGQDYTNWNQGWSYRNDGVDIEPCSDEASHTNGYNVGWTEDDEWMQYTVLADSLAAWQLNIRYATSSDEASVHLEIDGTPVTEKISLPSTDGGQSWQKISVDDVIIPEGKPKVKFVIDKGGVNLNYFSFTNPVKVDDAEFRPLKGSVDFPGNVVKLILNKPVTEGSDKDLSQSFGIESNGESFAVADVSSDVSDSRILEISLDELIDYNQDVSLSYEGTSLISGEQKLTQFSKMDVDNRIPQIFRIPGQIEAEDFLVNKGYELEDCEDNGGGKNIAYANPGDFIEFAIDVAEENEFTVDYRVATERQNAKLLFQIARDDEFQTKDTMAFEATGGWQVWKTQTGKVTLPAGRYKIRLKTLSSEYNLNWFDLSVGSSILDVSYEKSISLHPNPANDFLNVQVPFEKGQIITLYAYNSKGELVQKWFKRYVNQMSIQISDLEPGFYVLLARGKNQLAKGKFLCK
ncbi:MAG: carbohydrate-binding protein, partial [Bacteroidota bacterium]